MKIAIHIARILLGLPFLVFGLNGFFEFLEPPQPPTQDAAAFIGALAGANHFWTLLKGTEVVCGLLLVAGVYVPLALTVLAPILLNILVYHLALDPSGTPLAGGLVVLEVFLAWSYRTHLKGVLRTMAQPSGQD